MSPRRLLPLLVCARPLGRRMRRRGALGEPVRRDLRHAPIRPLRRPGAAADPARRSLPVLVSNAIAVRPGPHPVPLPRRREPRRERAGPDRHGRVLQPRHATRTRPSTTAEGAFVWTIEDERGMYVVDVDLPEAGTWGAEFTTEAPGSPRRDGPADVLRSASRPTDGRGRAEGAGLEDPDRSPTSAATSRRSRPTPTRTRPSTRPRSPTRSPPRSRSCSSSRRRSSARRPSAARRSTSFKPIAAAHPEVTFINVEPYQLQDVDGQLQPVLDANNQLQATPTSRTSGACSPSRGSSRSIATGSCAARTS